MSNLKNKIKSTYILIVNFGLQIAFYSTAFTFFHKRMETSVLTDFFNKRKDKSIKKYLRKNYAYVLKDYVNIQDISHNKNYIWICWWQGENDMPLIVKKCFQSVCEYSKPYEVVLITKDNFSNYVTFPEFIISKFEQNIFSVTHFSDILRTSLLARYGGLWIDATVFVTKNIKIDGDFFTIKHIDYGHHPSQRKWTQFLIGGNTTNPLFVNMRNLFFAYWKNENFLINYFLIDYLIMLVYEENESVKKMVDNFPYSNPELYYLLEYINTPYNEVKFKEVTENTTFHKLKWKQPLREFTENGELTYYGYIIS